ncbi:MAG: argininosuccinate lyase [Anaerolineae bacterium]|nr:argininosuccinate lyase [Anaerolineae bacterium]MCO5204931.1 argininosuccinate lyase [Anaerolineae bacterium]
MMSKLWGGRFAKEAHDLLRQFNDSIDFDQRLWSEDIEGSMAWARGLVGVGVLTATEANTIVRGLEMVSAEWESGTFTIQPGDEDIHTANERRLIELIGDVGGKLHTGRSRNDQVATDFRLWTKRAVDQVQLELHQLQTALVDHAEQHMDIILPGFTHLQHAQPVLWGHWLLAHFWPLERDQKRWDEVRDSADSCPLGSAALAGSAFPVNREALAARLGFSRITPNSLDAVSDRDFSADFLYAAAMTGLHLSRLSEQLILFSSQEFGFVRLDDTFSTGSSIMPQKKNPDTLELTRGKSGRLVGLLVGLMTTLKGLPSTYDKDLQEDKEGVFNAFDTLTIVLPVMTGVINTLKLQPERMAAQLEPGLIATDMADYLVKKGLPFRQAHHIVGEIVQLSETSGVPITELSLTQLQAISLLFEPDVVEAFSIAGSLAARDVVGGTAPNAVREQIAFARQVLR